MAHYRTISGLTLPRRIIPFQPNVFTRLQATLMKRILSALLLACSPLVLAQGTDTVALNDLAAARQRYKNAIAHDTQNYLHELEQLKASASLTGDSTLAAAVRTETASLAGTGPARNGLDENDLSSADGLKERLINTTWVWNRKETITLLPDGMAKWNLNGAESFTWRVAGTTPPVIAGTTPKGKSYRMAIDADLKTGKVFEGTLPGRITSQITAR